MFDQLTNTVKMVIILVISGISLIILISNLRLPAIFKFW